MINDLQGLSAIYPHKRVSAGAYLLGLPTGEPVFSDIAGDVSTQGNTVFVDNTHGSFIYGRLDRIQVKSGQTIQRGDVLGYAPKGNVTLNGPFNWYNRSEPANPKQVRDQSIDKSIQEALF